MKDEGFEDVPNDDVGIEGEADIDCVGGGVHERQRKIWTKSTSCQLNCSRMCSLICITNSKISQAISRPTRQICTMLLHYPQPT